MITVRLVPALGLLLPSLAAFAQAGTADRDALRACARIGSESERLECIDRVFAPTAKAGTEPEQQQTLDTQDPSATDKPLGRDADAQPVNEATSSERKGERTILIVEVRETVPGRAVFVTEAGEEFVQTSTGSNRLLQSAPFEAVIQEGLLGSTFLVPERGSRLKVAPRDVNR